MKTVTLILKTILNILLILFVFLYLLVFFPFPFIKGKTTEEYNLIDIGRDSIFQFQRYNNILSIVTKTNFSSKRGIPFTITVLGNTDHQTEVYVKYNDHLEKFYSCTLYPGKIDTTFHGELYEDRAEIVYLHNEAKQGNLKITFRLGSAKSTL
jgi:hypothetical protein